jgi:hypothetical protein
MQIDTSVLRLTWSVVEEIPNTQLLILSDIELVVLLLQRITDRMTLSADAVGALFDYLAPRTALIRDMATNY